MNNVTKLQTILFAGLIGAMILPFSVMNFAEAEKLVDDKYLIKEKIKDKMNELSDKDKKEKDTDKKYSSDEYGIPYNLIFEDNTGKLIVGIDIEKTLDFDEDYTLEEVKNDLDTDEDIEVRYYGFVRESHGPTSTNVYGGSTIKKSTGTNTWDDATITLIRDNNIITTGHLATGTGTTLYMSCGGTNLCSGTISSNPNADPQGADAALVTTSSSYLSLQANKIKYGTTTYSVTDGTSSDIVQYASVKMVGSATPTSNGSILDVDVTVKDSNGVLNDQVIANYGSLGGDSGAPVFITTGSTTAKIIGQHVGKFCEVDLHSETNYAQWCSNTITGEGALTVFSPWPAVKSNLGIS